MFRLPISIDGDVAFSTMTGIEERKIMQAMQIGPDLDSELTRASSVVAEWKSYAGLMELEVKDLEEELNDLEALLMRRKAKEHSGEKLYKETLLALARKEAEYKDFKQKVRDARVLKVMLSAAAESAVLRHRAILKKADKMVWGQKDHLPSHVGRSDRGRTQRSDSIQELEAEMNNLNDY